MTLFATGVTWLVGVVLAGAQRAQPQSSERRAVLADTVIDGIPCGKTGKARAEFHENGRLLECPITRDLTIATQQLPRGTWVRLRDDGTLYGAWLSRDAVLSGHLCHGAGYKSWDARFHRSGALASCYLPAMTPIDGVPCREGTFWGELRARGRTAAQFHPNGRLAQCVAAQPFVVDGVRFAKWTVVARDSAGRPTSAR